MYRVCLIGLGDVGIGYLHQQNSESITHFEAINLNPNMRLICGVDPIKPKNWPNTIPHFRSVSEIDYECEVIVVASSTKTHLQVLNDISGLRHLPNLVLLEKPAGYNLSEVSKITELSKIHNFPILVNFFRDCSTEAILELLDKDKITSIQINFTGTLLNIGYHFLQFSKTIIDKELKLISTTQFSDYIIYCCMVGEIELIAIERKTAHVPENNITFYTEKSKVVYDNENNQILKYNHSNNGIYVEEEIYSIQKITTANLDKGFTYVYSEMTKVLQGLNTRLPSIFDIEGLRKEFEYES